MSTPPPKTEYPLTSTEWASSTRLNLAIKWPYYAIAGGGMLVPGAVAFGAMYWWIGGMPFQGQDMMTMLQGYGIGAGAFYLMI